MQQAGQYCPTLRDAGCTGTDDTAQHRQQQQEHGAAGSAHVLYHAGHKASCELLVAWPVGAQLMEQALQLLPAKMRF